MDNNDVRLCDLAIASNIMQEELHVLIWENAYRHIVGRHPGSAFDLMRVSMRTAIITRQQGLPVTANEIAKQLKMPHSNVTRHLEVLLKHMRVRRVKRRWEHDLDQLDQLMASRANIERAKLIVQTCLTQWEELLPQLDHLLK